MLKKLLALAAMLYAVAAMAAVDVNKASEAELDGVKGIGPGTTRLIMAERKRGEFKDWADFTSRVKGIGQARAAKLSKEGLTVNGAQYTATAEAKPSKSGNPKEGSKAKDTKG